MLSVNNKREERRRNENKTREDINERKEDKRLKKEILILSIVSPYSQNRISSPFQE
jgi:hypothetical protein